MRRRNRGFSLVELVIVVVIIAIIAAIAVPRISRGARGAQAAQIEATLEHVRKAIDLYFAEHSQYPGYDPDTGTPSGTDFVDQLTMFTDEAGETSATLTVTHRYGPYLRAPFATNPLNGLNTVTVIATPSGSVALGSSGWIAVLSNGDFGINADEADLEIIGLEGEKVRIGGGGMEMI